MRHFPRLVFGLAVLTLPTAASAQNLVNKYGFVGADGTVIDPAYESTHEFSEGLAAVARDRNGPYGYIDKRGRMVIEPQFTEAGYFFHGYAFVKKSNDANAPTLVIDQRGKTVRELKGIEAAGEMTPGRNGPVPFQKDGDKYGFMNEKGDVVIQPIFDQVGYFSEGLAAVRAGGKKGLVGFIDTTGKVVIEPKFYYDSWLRNTLERYPEFHNGRAPVSLDSANTRFGYTDRTGRMVVPPAYAGADYFSNGLAPVWKSGTSRVYAYIDTAGTAVTPFKYTSAWAFTNGVALVEWPDSLKPNGRPRSALIDTAANIVFTIPGAEITQPPTEGFLSFKIRDAKGFVTSDGTVVVPPTYESLWQMQDGMAKYRSTVKVPFEGSFSGTHYIWYEISAGVASFNGGTSYYVHYAHVYGPKGLRPSQIAEAVTVKKDFPVMTTSKGSGSFEYNAEQIHKDKSSAVDEALKAVGVMRGSHRVGSYGTVDNDRIWPENIGSFSANK